MTDESNENSVANGTHQRIPMNNLDRPNVPENAEDSAEAVEKSKKWDYLLNIATKVVKWKTNNETEDQRRIKWKNRRIRLASRFPGGIKEEDKVDNPSVLINDQSFNIRSRKKPSVFQYAKEGILGKGQAKTQDKVDSASVILNAVLDRDGSPREFGVGLAGELLQNEYDTEAIPTFVRQQMDEMEDYRPYFSYWITTVQIIIMIITLTWYSIAPIGVEMALKSDFVFTESLTYQQVAFYEPTNFWIGPKPADVIHLGAVFAPCMRHDKAIRESVEIASKKENELSGCCVRNDGSGCLQTTRNSCSPLLSTFFKWTESNPGPGNRIRGPVCGQDPRYCENPISKAPHVWADDLRQWPICLATNIPSRGSHAYMTCKITAKPCCIGIHGRCEMRSREYCEFVGGYFHPEASVCSQVSCMADVCGILSFVSR